MTAEQLVRRLINEGTAVKPIHGAPVEKYVPDDMQDTPPVPFKFKVGDDVIYTNGNGLESNAKIRGFKSHPEDGRFVYLLYLRGDGTYSPGMAWWFAVKPEKISPSRPLGQD